MIGLLRLKPSHPNAKAAARRVFRGNDGLSGHGQQPHGRRYRRRGRGGGGEREVRKASENRSFPGKKAPDHRIRSLSFFSREALTSAKTGICPRPVHTFRSIGRFSRQNRLPLRNFPPVPPVFLQNPQLRLPLPAAIIAPSEFKGKEVSRMTARVTTAARPALRHASAAVGREASRQVHAFRIAITKPVFPVS